MDMTARENKQYTYADYMTFNGGFRCEIIDGVIYDMSPSPMRRHQTLSWKLTNIIGNYFDGKTCQMYYAPFDVRLPKPDETDATATNVVQPDIVVICDPDKLDDYGCKGAPDWVIEILSPSTKRKDRRLKFNLYEDAGVQEYWIVDPQHQTVGVFVMQEDGMFGSETVYAADRSVTPSMFPELTVDLAKVFAE